MAETVKFTEARVAALRQSVKAGRVEFKDEEIPGLLLRVTPTAASWSLVKRLPGSGVTRVSLGKADAVSVTEARKLARIRIGEMHQGIDPNAVKRQKRAVAQRDGLTLGEGLAIYLAERDQLRPATRVTYERDLRTTFGDYWDRPLMELTPERVRDRHRDRKTRDIRAQAKVETALSRKRIKASPARADGAVRALRAIVNYLRAERDLDLPDVAKRITATKGWGNVARRRRALVGDALPEFVASIRALPDDLPPDLSGTQRDVTLFLLCTALRWTAGAGLEWSEIDFKAKSVTIPAWRMKGKQDHPLPLGPQMMAMLKQRQKEARSDRFVFPGLGRREGEKLVYRALGRLSKQFLEKVIDAEGDRISWSPHDLRRTAISVLEAMDVSGYALKKIAAHSQGADVTAGYLTDDVERLRSPIERLERKVFGAAGSKVVALKRRTVI
ncbi:tyrosine-type recombinase/integrase [Lysobacter sp. GCM10012299]|uniref:tyrosine-type recombinase/integrase n=1 Tax=Lysobacter sp. GCM10012299 TaxID=3317333 RepID=UPI00360C5AB3